MRYLAKSIVTYTPQGTEDQQVYRAGEVIPNFHTWPEHARRTLLQVGKVEADFDPAQWVAKDDPEALLHALRERAQHDPRIAAPDVHKMLAKLKGDAPPPPEAPAPQQPAAEPEAPPAAAEDDTKAEDEDEDEEPVDHVCPLCPKTFPSTRALAVHRTKAHGGM